MVEFLKEKNCRKIFDLISHNPGLHSSKIAELLNIKISEVEHHLQYLEKKGIISATKEVDYKQYYIEDSKVKTRDERTLETRKKIFYLLARNPGLHLSKIAELLDMSVPLADYHLLYMERKREIIAVKDASRYYKRYYIPGSGIESQDKKVLEVLRKKVPLEVVLLLLKHHNLKHKEISENLGMSPSDLSYHLTELVNNEIVDVRPHGKEKGIVLKNRRGIVRIMKKYKLRIELNIAIEEFVEVWQDLHYGD